MVGCGGCVGVKNPSVQLSEACRGKEEVCDGGGHGVYYCESEDVQDPWIVVLRCMSRNKCGVLSDGMSVLNLDNERLQRLIQSGRGQYEN